MLLPPPLPSPASPRTSDSKWTAVKGSPETLSKAMTHPRFRRGVNPNLRADSVWIIVSVLGAGFFLLIPVPWCWMSHPSNKPQLLNQPPPIPTMQSQHSLGKEVLTGTIENAPAVQKGSGLAYILLLCLSALQERCGQGSKPFSSPAPLKSKQTGSQQFAHISPDLSLSQVEIYMYVLQKTGCLPSAHRMVTIVSCRLPFH